MMRWMALLLLVLLLSCARADDAATPALQDRLVAALGVGDDASHVRLMYEVDQDVTVEVYFEQFGHSPVLYARIEVRANWGMPAVLHMRGLQVPAYYRGAFYASDGSKVPFSFTTRAERVLFLSCNRYAEDGDASMLAELAATPSDLAVHMGDQVYLDGVARQTTHADTFDVLVERIRAVYRSRFGHSLCVLFIAHNAHTMHTDGRGRSPTSSSSCCRAGT